MNKLSKMTMKLMAIAPVLAITLTLLAACAPGVPLNICHATDDPANPYEQVNVTTAELLNEHRVHPNDIIPAPAGGCPTTLEATSPAATDGKITICHATGSATNPYVKITVSVNGLNGHDKHPKDIIPAPADGCPTAATP